MPHQPWNDLQFIAPYFDGSLGRCWPASHPVGVSSHQPSRQRWKLPTRTYCMFILLSLFLSLFQIVGVRTCYVANRAGLEHHHQGFEPATKYFIAVLVRVDNPSRRRCRIEGVASNLSSISLEATSILTLWKFDLRIVDTGPGDFGCG